MTDFEYLLLKNGDLDLICAFIRDYSDILSRDFVKNFVIYKEKIEQKLADAMCCDPLKMKIGNFLEIYGRNTISTTLKTRICKNLEWCSNIETVQDLLKYRKSDIAKMRNLGKKAVMQLDKTLQKIGYKLED